MRAPRPIRRIKLTIFTALTLEKPKSSNANSSGASSTRSSSACSAAIPISPMRTALRTGTLPPNIEVNEFFFLAGRWLGVPRAQQSYISANYTHAVRYLVERGVNVVAQLVAKTRRPLQPELQSRHDPRPAEAQQEGRAKFLLAGQVNSELPFMPGDARAAGRTRSPISSTSVHGVPAVRAAARARRPREYAIGLHAARLVADGGTLQIGIGEEGDAAVHALILRHRENARFREAVTR